MRNDIRHAFDDNTEEPHPALRSAIRRRLEAGRPADRPLYRFAPFAAAAAVVLLVVGTGYYALTHGSTPRQVPAAGIPSPSASSGARTSPSPEPSPSAAATAAAAVYSCAVSNGGTPGGPDVTGVRVGTAGGYDRFVIQFDGPVPPYTVTPQDSSSFSEDGSGRIFRLQGSAGLRVVVHNSSAHSVTGTQTYTGPNDFTEGFPVLKEARNMGDYERVYTWGLGMSGPNCYRAYTLTGPDRLVVDVQSP